MEEIELRTLILRGEDSTLQFKRQVDSCERLAPELVAFLNKRGGQILIGVSDVGSITGLSPEQIRTTNQIIGNTTESHVVPRITVETQNVVTTDGVVIVLTVAEGIDKPYQTNRGEFYVKTGADKRHVTHRDELRRLFQIGSHVFAEKQVLSGSNLDQIDLDAYREYYRKRFSEAALASDDDLIDQMRLLNLIKDDKLTLAGALLFGLYPESLYPQFATKAVWFNGTDSSGSTYHDDRRILGTLPDMYEEVIEFLNAWNMRRQQPGASYNENSQPLVEPAVFEEILTNAFVHRDYFIPESIKVFIFDDRIEIYSPGSLPNSLTLDEATNGISRSRNPIIENIGNVLMEYKGHGTGLKRAKRLCPGIQFDNNVDKNAFIVTIPF